MIFQGSLDLLSPLWICTCKIHNLNTGLVLLAHRYLCKSFTSFNLHYFYYSQIVTRGKIVDAYWDQVSNQIVKPLTDDLQEKLSPGGRFIVFYCDLRTGEVVADAIKVSVTPRCKGEGVSNCLITKLFRKKLV